jgi:hypothetical protein
MGAGFLLILGFVLMLAAVVAGFTVSGYWPGALGITGLALVARSIYIIGK